MNTVEKLQYRDYTIKIEVDDNPGNPRKEWDNAAKMICFHRNYDLGDEHDFRSPDDFTDYLKENAGDIAVLLPLYLYDHSGLSISTSSYAGRAHAAEWDSGGVGCIYLDRETVKREWGWDRITSKRRALLLDVLRSEVAVYDSYLTGSVYGYVVEWKGEEVDSCWGFYGETDYPIEEAKRVIDYCIDEGPRVHLATLESDQHSICAMFGSDDSKRRGDTAIPILTCQESDFTPHNFCRECIRIWNTVEVE